MSVLVGREAPEFSATAVINGEIVNDFKLSRFRGKHVLLFFYPLDFTFVCPTELHAFQSKLADFDKMNCEVIAVSTDSQFSHQAWLNTPKSKGGIEGIQYPLVADITKSIAASYDVLVPDAGIAFRGAFLIDTKGIVRHQTVNDLPLGRNIDEFLRLVEAQQFVEEHGEVCPANWNRNENSMKPTKEGLEEYYGK